MIGEKLRLLKKIRAGLKARKKRTGTMQRIFFAIQRVEIRGFTGFSTNSRSFQHLR